MGRQSARMYYQGKDHVDIICDRLIGDGNHTVGLLENYYKIYDGDKLIWKKEIPRYVFSSGNVIYTTDKLKTFSGFKFCDYRSRQFISKGAYSIGFLAGIFLLTSTDGKGIFCSNDGYTWKTLLESEDEKYGTIKRYGNALYVLTSKRLLRITKSGGEILLNTAFIYTDVLKGKECLGISMSPSKAFNGFLVGDGYMLVPVWTGNVTKPIGSTVSIRASTHTLLSFSLNTGNAEIVATNLPYNITSYTGGCYHDGYFYCSFWNGKEELFGETPKTLIRRSKDGYAWETYSSLDKYSGAQQLFFVGEYLYFTSGSESHRRTKNGVEIEKLKASLPVGCLFFIEGNFFFQTLEGEVCSSADYFDVNSWEVKRVTLGKGATFYSTVCSDNSVEIIG